MNVLDPVRCQERQVGGDPFEQREDDPARAAAAGFKKGDTITVEQVPGLVEEYLAEGVNGEVTIEQMDGDSIVLTGSPKTESARYYGSFTVTAGGTTWKSMNGSESATAGGTTITARRPGAPAGICDRER